VNPNLRRFLVALVAWPLGLAAALALAFGGARATCPAGEPCPLNTVPEWRVALWLALALGPGLLATWAWWRGWRTSRRAA
jgi:hypothetical protein